MNGSDHFFDVGLVDTDIVFGDEVYISFFLLSYITIDDWDFVHHENFHQRGRSSFGDDDVRDVYQVIHEVDESEYFDDIIWIIFGDFLCTMI